MNSIQYDEKGEPINEPGWFDRTPHQQLVKWTHFDFEDGDQDNIRYPYITWMRDWPALFPGEFREFREDWVVGDVQEVWCLRHGVKDYVGGPDAPTFQLVLTKRLFLEDFRALKMIDGPDGHKIAIGPIQSSRMESPDQNAPTLYTKFAVLNFSI